MRNGLTCSSFTRVAVIMVVIAFLAGQVTDSYAGKSTRNGQHVTSHSKRDRYYKREIKVREHKQNDPYDHTDSYAGKSTRNGQHVSSHSKRDRYYKRERANIRNNHKPKLFKVTSPRYRGGTKKRGLRRS